MNHPIPHLQYASVCSGIEAVSVAWQPLGLTPAWFSEIQPFPCAVLAHHYPDIPNYGDMTLLADQVSTEVIAAPPILVGGTPCQAFSIAGFRAGLADPRGVLCLRYVELANAIDQVRARRDEAESIIVWENVPGVLSDTRNAFGCFLAALAGEEDELHPPRKTWSDAGIVFGPQRTIAWRVLDAQYFGVAQRRRRVFLVASARTGFDPAAVLFESEGLRRDTAPDRTSTPITTSGVGASVTGCRRVDGLRVFANSYGMAHGQAGAETSLECCPTLTCNHEAAIVVCATGDITHCLRAEGFGASEDGTGRGHPIAPWLTHQVRRLLPKEYERLQGLPDDYTRVPRRFYTVRRVSRSRPVDSWEATENGWMLMAADGPRYKAIGNSIAVPCLTWIGKRLLFALSQSGNELNGIHR
ncbi:DNA cytosine methyltransferase [Pseudomonas caspiana]|nr:DNA cytosine methyltransferase [Pseudomonas caspiana]TPG90336.1 DNA cytosine methyltransferase [Pseudomonas caspiana]